VDNMGSERRHHIQWHTERLGRCLDDSGRVLGQVYLEKNRGFFSGYGLKFEEAVYRTQIYTFDRVALFQKSARRVAERKFQESLYNIMCAGKQKPPVQ